MADDFIVQAQGLKKKYKSNFVVKGVDFNIKKGTITGLLGANGAGKTTTFYMVVGLVKATSGKIYFDNVDITRMPMYKRMRLGMGYLAQEPSIFRKLTVEQNILAILEVLKISRKQRYERLNELIEDFSLQKVRKQLALTLSGGERRRLEIARSLVTNPRLLLLDEPFSGVDPIAVNEVQKIIIKLKNRGLSILITDHNVREMLSIVDYAYMMYEGEIFVDGLPKDLVNNDEAKEKYIGHNFSLN